MTNSGMMNLKIQKFLPLIFAVHSMVFSADNLLDDISNAQFNDYQSEVPIIEARLFSVKELSSPILEGQSFTVSSEMNYGPVESGRLGFGIFPKQSHQICNVNDNIYDAPLNTANNLASAIGDIYCESKVLAREPEKFEKEFCGCVEDQKKSYHKKLNKSDEDDMKERMRARLIGQQAADYMLEYMKNAFQYPANYALGLVDKKNHQQDSMCSPGEIKPFFDDFVKTCNLGKSVDDFNSAVKSSFSSRVRSFKDPSFDNILDTISKIERKASQKYLGNIDSDKTIESQYNDHFRENPAPNLPSLIYELKKIHEGGTPEIHSKDLKALQLALENFPEGKLYKFNKVDKKVLLDSIDRILARPDDKNVLRSNLVEIMNVKAFDDFVKEKLSPSHYTMTAKYREGRCEDSFKRLKDKCQQDFQEIVSTAHHDSVREFDEKLYLALNSLRTDDNYQNLYFSNLYCENVNIDPGADDVLRSVHYSNQTFKNTINNGELIQRVENLTAEVPPAIKREALQDVFPSKADQSKADQTIAEEQDLGALNNQLKGMNNQLKPNSMIDKNITANVDNNYLKPINKVQSEIDSLDSAMARAQKEATAEELREANKLRDELAAVKAEFEALKSQRAEVLEQGNSDNLQALEDAIANASTTINDLTSKNRELKNKLTERMKDNTPETKPSNNPQTVSANTLSSSRRRPTSANSSQPVKSPRDFVSKGGGESFTKSRSPSAVKESGTPLNSPVSLRSVREQYNNATVGTIAVNPYFAKSTDSEVLQSFVERNFKSGNKKVFIKIAGKETVLIPMLDESGELVYDENGRLRFMPVNKDGVSGEGENSRSTASDAYEVIENKGTPAEDSRKHTWGEVLNIIEDKDEQK